MRDARGVEICSLSDKGQVRRENQDNTLVDPANALFILADGAGGGLGGGTASRLTVDTMGGRVQSLLRGSRRYRIWDRQPRASRLTEILSTAAQAANSVVVSAASASSELTGMASTVVAGVIDAQRCIAVTAGDSRIYHFRGGRLAQVSEDHSLARQLIERGFISEDDNKASKYRNVLTRAVGMQENIELSTHDIALENGDIVLACSDGLTNMLSDAAIAAVLSKAIPLEEQASELIQSANEAGGLDNISVILIRYRRLPTILSRLLGQ